ncbi:hypothetical protein [Lacimicrobium alkaliphilum]|uniref:Uncharacterized protein n=1 Tax=Lacimicrobium alkaliphilum TaxID=1526571 RepID=A0A0U3AYR5_9ALTE|nr:hypothetical protein [Lacimicrobium alkaliphilum]ALS99263.1 hypothetical protein AT746_14025 [Lacimicrobium alkaliphilum]
MKKLPVIALLAGIGFNAAASAENDKQIPQINGFDCADAIQNVIPLLGRGELVETFVPLDVENELKRQHKSSVLQSINCTAEPEIKGATIKDKESGEAVLSRLSVTFPLEISVAAGKQTMDMVVHQQYLAENLETTDQRKVTQKFIVK